MEANKALKGHPLYRQYQAALEEQHTERLEQLRQECETVLGILESKFLNALISGDWTEFKQFVESFKAQ